MEKIENLLEQMKRVDENIAELLNRRAQISKEIGALKKQNDDVLYDSSRIKSSLDTILKTGKGILSQEALQSIFLEILSQCQDLEQSIKVGYLGPEGTFTHQASLLEFGSAAELLPFPCVDDLFTSVEKKQVDCSVVAIENSTGGVVHDVLDRFMDSDVKITSEIVIYIHHCLISNATLEKVERIYSHPQPFRQCRRWLRENLPKARYIEVASTVEGMRLAGETPGSAAIGSEIAARLGKMNIIASNIQDTTENFTRFVVLGRLIPQPTGADKTSLILSLKHKPGALFEALKCFAEKSINLTKIESRPTRQRPWEYVFFI
ncbi:prephenate dehydratase, partial [Candidatus Sumerlaeota bacterium]|nr:prephenate dehydratase [Candidatus Sumerlaeota bacterium]